MYGLMSHWFAPPAGLALEGGYFYLCPRCFEETIAPDLEGILDKLREHLPAPPSTPHAGFMHAPGDGQAPPPRTPPARAAAEPDASKASSSGSPPSNAQPGADPANGSDSAAGQTPG